MNSQMLPNEHYPIDDISIKTPKALQGGTYSAGLEINSKPIIIQTPKCKTKKGIHKTSKQVYCDLLFQKDRTENLIFINWLDKVQEKVRSLIYNNGDNWFHDKPSVDEIEYNWNDSIRSYKTNYNLIRTFILKNKTLNKLNIQIYDDNENELHLENIDENKNVICILELKGLKFSSQSFHLEIFLRQVMLLNEKPLFSKCLISKTNLQKNQVNLEQNKSNNIESTDVKKSENSNSVENNSVENNSVENNSVENNNLDSDDDLESDNDLETNENLEKSENLETSENLEKSENLETNNDLKTNNDLEKSINLEKPTITKTTMDNNKDIKSDNDTLEKNSLKDNLTNDILNTDLQEINVNVSNTESIKLKNANDVYLEIYKKAREKAKKSRNDAIKAYLEVKRIKDLYMIDVIDSSDEDENEEFDD